MSIKIYNGYKIINEEKYKEDIIKVREKWMEIAIEEIAKKYLKRIEEEGLKKFDEIYSSLKKNQEEISNSPIRQMEYDYDSELRRLNDSNLLMLFAEEREQRKAFEEKTKDSIKKYPYYNNTDNDEGLSYEEWEDRGEEWKKALGGWYNIVEEVSTEVVKYKEFPTKEELKKFLQSSEIKKVKEKYIKVKTKKEVLQNILDERFKITINRSSF